MQAQQPHTATKPTTIIPDILEVHLPDVQTFPAVISVPHSGRIYPDHFLQQTVLSDLDIRRSEDAFVDDLFSDAPQYGLPLLKALFPRAYVDVNREAYELDPSMFDAPPPTHINSTSPRAYVGLGTIPSIVTQGMEIYGGKIPLQASMDRIETCYFPYHANLAQLIEDTVSKFGKSFLLDCHSMPSPKSRDSRLPDFVLGDRFGTTCAPELVSAIESFLRANGYTVGRNMPYAGAYMVKQYGRPEDGQHALQLEIRRSLYMDERTLRPTKGLRRLQALMNKLLEHICSLPEETIPKD